MDSLKKLLVDHLKPAISQLGESLDTQEYIERQQTEGIEQINNGQTSEGLNKIIYGVKKNKVNRKANASTHANLIELYESLMKAIYSKDNGD